jgi:hypothetical protein
MMLEIAVPYLKLFLFVFQLKIIRGHYRKNCFFTLFTLFLEIAIFTLVTDCMNQWWSTRVPRINLFHRLILF